MDPLTAGLQLATQIVGLAAEVWKATPASDQAAIAGDIAKTMHNCSVFFQALQVKINVQ